MDIRKDKKVGKTEKISFRKDSLTENEEIEKAVAFKIEDDEARVVSIGIGSFAELIKKEAQEHQVPIYKDKDVTNNLISFDINVPLPPSAYNLIATFINFVSSIDSEYRKKKL